MASDRSEAAPAIQLPPDVAERVVGVLQPQIGAAFGQEPTVVKVEVSTTSTYRGSVPPPAYLKGFEEVVPGSADRILTMAEGAERHSRRMDLVQAFYAYTGLLLGFGALAGDIGAAVFLAMHDKTLVASLLRGIPVIGAIDWFVQARLANAVKLKDGAHADQR